MAVGQAILLGLVSVVMALGINSVSPNSIGLVGQYRSLSNSEGPIVPPNAEDGDPQFIDINQAQMEFTLGTATFVDSRDPEEFVCGTIPGSVNIPFEYLPEFDLEQYLDSSLGYVSHDEAIIIFCSGEECDLSLHLGRNLQDLGYTKALIFFGGSREWEQAGLNIQRRQDCGN